MVRPHLLSLWLAACALPTQVAAQAEGAALPAEPQVSTPADPSPAPPSPPLTPRSPLPQHPQAQVSSLAEAVRGTGSGALPALLEAVEQAQRAGLGASTDLTLAEARAKLRAAADLSLLSEVTSFASASLKNLPAGARTAMATVGVRVNRITQAFDLARKAGVAEEELAAATKALHQEVVQRLSKATARAAAGKGRMDVAAIEELAQTIFLASRLKLSTEEVAAATQLLEDEMNGELSTDMSFVEGVVDVAEATNIKIPSAYYQWKNSLSRLRQVAVLEQDKKENLQTFSAALSRAREIGLPPGTRELVDVVAKAHACCKGVLGSLVAQAGTNSSTANPLLLEELLSELDRAREMGVGQLDLAQAASTAQNLARAEMHTALAMGGQEGKAAKYIIDKAKKAGVSAAEIDSQIAQLTSKAKLKLSAAASALSNYSATGSQVRELAMMIHRAAHAGGDLTDELANARSKYAQKLAGPFGPGDEDLFEALVGMCDHAGVTPAPELFKQHKALLEAQRASSGQAACSGDEPRKLETLLRVFRQAKDAELPNFAPLLDVQSKVQRCAVAALNATEEDLEARLAKLEVAYEVGVPELSFAAHLSQASSEVRANLRDVLAATSAKANAVNDALSKAGRVRLPRAEVDTAVASLANGTLARLRAAQARMSFGGGAAEIKELAEAMSVARIRSVAPLLKEALAAAGTFYEEKMAASFQSGDLPLAQAAVEGAGQAGVQVTGDMHNWVNSARRLREAVEADVHHPRRLQEILDGAPDTQDKTILQGRARAQAKAELEESLAGGNYDAVKAALAAAAQAGVPETTLQAGRAVLNAL